MPTSDCHRSLEHMAAKKPTYNLGDPSHQNTKGWSLICVSYFVILCRIDHISSYFILDVFLIFSLSLTGCFLLLSHSNFPFPRHQKFRTAWASTCTTQLSRVDMAQGLEKLDNIWQLPASAAGTARCKAILGLLRYQVTWQNQHVAAKNNLCLIKGAYCILHCLYY